MDSSTPLLAQNQTTGLVKFRRLAYAASCLCCLFSASFTVFSLYTNFFESELGYTPLQLNYISIGAEMGLYLCVPALGFIADAFKLSHLGIISCITYLVGYGGCAWVVGTHQTWPWMAFFFGIVGVACSAGFISSLVNCARLFPDSALLAISVPTTLYGCSSLAYSQVISQYVSDGFSIAGLYVDLSIILCCVGVLATFAPIWGNVNIISQLNLPREDEPEYEGDVQHAESHVKSFFKDHKILWLLFSFVLVSGPLEMYQNNIGLIANAQENGSNDRVAEQVALFTSLSTVIRLLVGAVTDIFSMKPSIVLLTLLAVLSLVDLAFAQGWASLTLMSAISGIGYGSSFTIYPLMVSHIGGIERFATYWGFFILGPAIGSFVFGVLFATNVQQSSEYGVTFRICAAGVILSCIVITRLRLHHSN